MWARKSSDGEVYRPHAFFPVSQAGYREGMTEGKEQALQSGFDSGFSEGAIVGMEIGRLRGLLRFIGESCFRILTPRSLVLT